jgi:hypothetical protein
MNMTPREIKEFKDHLEKRKRQVTKSKKAAREYLNSMGLLTPGGKLKKAFRPTSANVSR